ncbi:MAG: signal peptide peptidase SppA [Pseudomonadales bacterium]
MSSDKGVIMRFFGGISRFLQRVRLILINTVTAVVLILILFSLGSIFSQRETFEMPESGALRVALDGSLVDQKSYIDPADMLLNPDIPSETLVYELVKAIEAAATDPRINSMTLVLDDLESAGMSKIQELGKAILEFRKSGKPVIAVADNYSQQQYLLASYADRILMHPMGVVEVVGISSYNTYLAAALDKLKVDVHVFRTGPHKNAVEPFIANEMSPESREQSQRLIDELWGQYTQGILQRRNITPEGLYSYSNEVDQAMLQTGKSLGEIARDINLVDELVTRDQLMTEIQAIAGANDEGDFYNFTNAISYYQSEVEDYSEDSPRVGYIVAKGQIFDGVQAPGSIGGDSLAYQLKQARLKEDLSALVLRVDSPGGSAFASEVIRRELELYKEADIPVVISMGSLAASGGYWISTPADEIWATPSTITGSIGAFAVVPVIDRSMNALGLNTDGVDTTPLSSAFRLDKPLSDQAKSIFQSQIDFLYNEFLQIVSEGRNLSMEQLEPIAGGRVWTGTQALDLGLVDHLGGQFDAINSAATMAGIADNYQVHRIEPQLSLLEQLFRDLFGQLSVQLASMSSSTNWYQKIATLFTEVPDQTSILLSDPQNQYLHCGQCVLDI